MPWCADDYRWLADTLDLIGLACVGFGAALVFHTVGIWLRRRRARGTDNTFPPRMLTAGIIVFVGVQLTFVILFLTRSEIIRAAQEPPDVDNPLISNDLRDELNQLPEQDRRAIEQLARELAHLEQRLTTRTSVEELEAADTNKDQPFGLLNEEWEALKAEMIDGDELWLWSTSPQTWAALCGREGVALVRDGKVVAVIITSMN
jgi:hypothetical protein